MADLPAKSRHSQEAGDSPEADARICWILGADPGLRRRLARLVRERNCRTIESENALPQSAEGAPPPALIVLDTGEDADWGARMIAEIRKHRIGAPMVALTRAFSKDFGGKILAQGVRYYFSHDFCEREFSEVVASLLDPGYALQTAPEQRK